MSLVKNVGSKLDQKFKSGEIKESELMQEASDLLSKMKGMPGMNNLADMLNKMGMGGMMGGMGGGGGGKSKVNIGAMQSHLQRNMKVSQMKERMQQKLKLQQQQRDAALAAAAAATAAATAANPVKMPQVFSTGEVVERTPVEAPSSSKSNKKKKKK
jgi:hypothetical protein